MNLASVEEIQFLSRSHFRLIMIYLHKQQAFWAVLKPKEAYFCVIAERAN